MTLDQIFLIVNCKRGEMTADDIRAARKQLGKTQREFADLLGVAQNSIWRLENGISAITRSREQSINNIIALHSNAGENK